MRILRPYRRVAHVQHDCCNCPIAIEPGDYYEGQVCIESDGRLVVWKRHLDPHCPVDPLLEPEEHKYGEDSEEPEFKEEQEEYQAAA